MWNFKDKGEYLATPAIASGTQDNHVVLARAHNCQTIVIDNDGYNIAKISCDLIQGMIEIQKSFL